MSKLGLHIHSWNHAIFQYCKTVGGVVHIILDHNEMMVNDVKKAQPRSLLVARLWVPEQKLNDPIKNAQEFTDLLLLHIEGCNYDAATGYNEWDGDLNYHDSRPEGMEVFKRYADFEAERSRILHREGLLSVVGGCSVGTPPEHWFSAFKPALEEGDFLHLHEYSAPAMWDNSKWHCLKYKAVYKYLEEHNLPMLPLIISECGIDGGVVGRPREGWRKFTPARNYMTQWKWYDQELMNDPYVVGCCAFDCGGGGGLGWASFNMDPEMLGLWAPYVRGQGVSYWEPKEEEMVIPDWLVDVRETLKKHPDKKYARRGLGEIDTIVIHHTATTSASPEAIANYHVGTLKWPGAGYHLYIRKSGAAYLMNDLEAASYQCYKHNQHTLGLGFEGDFTKESHTEDQIRVGRLAVDWLCSLLGTDLPLRAHGKMPDQSTACPGKFPVGELTGEEPEPDEATKWKKKYEDLRNGAVAAIKTLQAVVDA